MDATYEVADLRERRFRFLVGVGDHRPRLFGIVVELLAGGAEPGRQRDEPLLGAVVEVALDAAPFGLGAVDRRRPARLEARHLLHEGLVGAGTEQPSGHRRLDVGRGERDPRGDEHQPGDTDRGRRRGRRGPT